MGPWLVLIIRFFLLATDHPCLVRLRPSHVHDLQKWLAFPGVLVFAKEQNFKNLKLKL